MNPAYLLFALIFAVPLAYAEGTPQYITDDVSVTLREAPRNDAASIGVLHSGDKVTMLETLGEQSFARVRPSAGAVGDRKSDVSGTSVSVRVAIGGCRILKKKQSKNNHLFTFSL